jgi:pimeloyl-ACP methyl ester carboxylesterase
MRRFLAVLTLLALVLLAVAGSASAKVRTGPAGDAFYTPPSPLPGAKHGDLIWARNVTGDPALTSAGKNWKVLYRSVGTDGKAIAVSGLVSLPKGKAPKRGWPVITYDHGTTGIADQCAPSEDADDNPAHLYNAYIYPLLNRWLKAGYAVVRTDYQGLGAPGAHEYLVGIAEGRSTLDIVRAARKLNGHLSRRFAISGHSQGGHAALWGAALAPKWTPDLTLRGTVAFAPASHIADQISAVSALKNPSPLSGLISMIFRGADTFKPGLNLSSILSDKATALYPETLSKCLPQLSASDSFGGIAPSEFLRDGADTSGLASALDASDPENLKVKSPVDIEQGTADTTVYPVFTDSLVEELRQKGATKIEYKKYDQVTHGGVVVSAADHATKYLRKRFR